MAQQLAGEGAAGRGSSMLGAARALVSAGGGVRALYSGLSAGLLRQATYTTARMGIFRSLSDWRSASAHEGRPLPMAEKAVCGLAAGFIGAYVGTPADLTLVRMQVREGATEARGSWAADARPSRRLPWQSLVATYVGVVPRSDTFGLVSDAAAMGKKIRFRNQVDARSTALTEFYPMHPSDAGGCAQAARGAPQLPRRV